MNTKQAEARARIDAILAKSDFRTVPDVAQWFDAMSALLSWHPDTDFADYIWQTGSDAGEAIFTGAQAVRLNSAMARCFEAEGKLGFDLYTMALESAQRAGWAPKDEPDTQNTLRAAVDLLRARNVAASLEYPGWINLSGLAFGDASGTCFGWNRQDCDASQERAGQQPRELPADASPLSVAAWIVAVCMEQHAERPERKPAIPLWAVAFPDYAVPAEVTQFPGIIDVSYHGNACPCFTLQKWERADRAADVLPAVVLWVEHPEISKRAFPTVAHRYEVSIQPEDGDPAFSRAIYTGEDIAAALAALERGEP